MSASIAGPSSILPSQQQKQLRDWLLPIPSDLGINDESFSNDLIRQFDKRRSRLRVETTDSEEPHATTTSTGAAGTPILSDNDTEDSIASCRPSVHSRPRTTATAVGTLSTLSSSPSRPSLVDRQQPSQQVLKEKRRRSAGDLLRRSSAYLRVKMDAFRPGSSPASRSHDNLRVRRMVEEDDDDNYLQHHLQGKPPPPPAKIIVNTTIALPQFNTNTAQSRFLSPAAAAIQPPIITHYPPKPLKYSPVDPPSDERSSPGAYHYKGILHHRISMPILRAVGRSSADHHHQNQYQQQQQQQQQQRRRSDADLGRSKPGGGKKGKERATVTHAAASRSNHGGHSAPPTLTLSR